MHTTELYSYNYRMFSRSASSLILWWPLSRQLWNCPTFHRLFTAHLPTLWLFSLLLVANNTLEMSLHSLLKKYTMITDCIRTGGNAIASVCLSVCFHSILWNDSPLTLNFWMCVGHYDDLQEIETEGHRSRSTQSVSFSSLMSSKIL